MYIPAERAKFGPVLSPVFFFFSFFSFGTASAPRYILFVVGGEVSWLFRFRHLAKSPVVLYWPDRDLSPSRCITPRPSEPTYPEYPFPNPNHQNLLSRELLNDAGRTVVQGSTKQPIPAGEQVLQKRQGSAVS